MDEAAPLVLVVDDDEELLALYEEYLADDYRVRTAKNGGEALVELDEDVDVVVLDRKMPGIRGEEVLAEIREWLDWCRVVMVTGIEPDFEIATLPFDDYLEKPVTRAELLDSVAQVLLLSRYEHLLNEYLSVTKRYAILRANKDEATLATSDRFEELADRRATLESEIEAVLAEFDDDVFAEALAGFHDVQLS